MEGKINTIHEIVTKERRQHVIQDTLRGLAHQEQAARDDTITINLQGSELNATKYEELILIEWCEKFNKPVIVSWKDKDNLYIQSASNQLKNELLDHVSTNDKFHSLAQQIQKPNSKGQHFTRKAVPLIINQLDKKFSLDSIKNVVSRMTGPSCIINEFKEGKTEMKTGKRSIFFKANAEGLKHLYSTFRGHIPMKENGSSTRLYIKINCRPYQCRDCYKFNQHQCQGKICIRCSDKGHTNKDCKQKEPHCSNCNTEGHKPTDTVCTEYLTEIGRQLRKMDIPLEYLIEEDSRYILQKHLQIK